MILRKLFVLLLLVNTVHSIFIVEADDRHVHLRKLSIVKVSSHSRIIHLLGDKLLVVLVEAHRYLLVLPKDDYS